MVTLLLLCAGCQGGGFVDVTQECTPGTPPVCNNDSSRLLCLDGVLKLEICGQVTCEGLDARCAEGPLGAVCECGLVPPPCSETVCHAPAHCGEVGCECTSSASVCKDGAAVTRAYCAAGALTYESCSAGVAESCGSLWDSRVCVEEGPGEAECVCLPCEPDCAGRDCGPDGCGGRCEVSALVSGDCAAEYGPQFFCGADGGCVCAPDCQGIECGPDGCGADGVCGVCKVEEGFACSDSGSCVDPCQGVACGPIPFPVGCGAPGGIPCKICSDSCADLEWKKCDDSTNLCVHFDPCQDKDPPWECGPHPSGVGECGEGCTSCLTTCNADTHQCEPLDPCLESGWSCGWRDCPNGEGQLACGELGGLCPVGTSCSNGSCNSNCPADEMPCGDQCCPPGSSCDPNPPVVGKDPCCWPQAGFVCLPSGESCAVNTCGDVSDCAPCPAGSDGYCDPASGQCVDCDVACADKECGAWDPAAMCPCGLLGGGCAAGSSCDASGSCKCVSNCEAKSCGDDGCGGLCGACLDNEQCSEEGQCICDTEVVCQDKECGVSGCPGVMCPNLCAEGLTCQGNTCVDNKCEGKECGPDGFGGWCGDCENYTHCEAGSCVPNVCGDGVCHRNVYAGNGVWAYLGEDCAATSGAKKCPQDCGAYQCHPNTTAPCGCVSGGVQNGTMKCAKNCQWGPCQEPECCSDADCSGACEVCLADGTCGLAASAECVVGSMRQCPGGKSCEFQFCEEVNCTWAPCSVQECCGGADTDGDGVGDNVDEFPIDPTESADGDKDGVGDNADLDDDNDGIPDVSPWASGIIADDDDDNDGVLDVVDAFPSDPTESVDSDGDGVGDNSDAFPDDPSETTDSDVDLDCHSDPTFGACHSCIDRQCVYTGMCVPGSVQTCDDGDKACGSQLCDEQCGWGECSAPECCAVADCPADPGDCLHPYCAQGTCAVFTEPDNTACGPSVLSWCEGGGCVCHPDCEVAGKGCGDNGCGDVWGCGICDDEEVCTSDACVNFQCEFTDIVPPVCCHADDQCEPHKDNNCYVPSCDANVCEFTKIEGCVPCATDGDCDDESYNPDNYPCTLDTCQEDETCVWDPQVGCVPCWDVADCDDGHACTSDVCEPDNTCSHSAVPGCVPCDLASECAGGTGCQERTCVLHGCGLADLAIGTPCNGGCGQCAGGLCEDLVCEGGCGVCTTCVCGQCTPIENGTLCDESRPNAQCVDGLCACEPTCQGLCGGAPDGCGGVCDAGCPVGEACAGIQCVCAPDCEQKCPGQDDGCGQGCPFTTCYEGCCDGDGVCRMDGTISACGNGGGACKACAGDGAGCLEGQCVLTLLASQSFDATHDTYVTEITPDTNHDGGPLLVGTKATDHHITLVRFPDASGSVPITIDEAESAQVCLVVSVEPGETMAATLREVTGCDLWDQSALTWAIYTTECSPGDPVQTLSASVLGESICFDLKGNGQPPSFVALERLGVVVEPLGGVDPSETQSLTFHSLDTGTPPYLKVSYWETNPNGCKESWTWSDWSPCDCSGQQHRTGTDENGCAEPSAKAVSVACEAIPCGSCTTCDVGACVPEVEGTSCGICSSCDGAGVCGPVQDGTSCDIVGDLNCLSGQCVCPSNPPYPTIKDGYEPNGADSCQDCLVSEYQSTACGYLPDDPDVRDGSWLSCEALRGSWTKGECQGSCDWTMGADAGAPDRVCALGAISGFGGHTAGCAPTASPEDIDVCDRTVHGIGDDGGPILLTGSLGGADSVDHYAFLVQNDLEGAFDPVVTLSGIPAGADYELCVGWSPGAAFQDLNACGWPRSWPNTDTMSSGGDAVAFNCQTGAVDAVWDTLAPGLTWCCSDNPGNQDEHVAIGGDALAWGVGGDDHGNLIVRVSQPLGGCFTEDYELEVQHF